MRRRKRARERQEKKEDRRPILKRFRAALRSFWERRKNGLCKGSARGNWDPWDGQQSFGPNPNGVRDRTTMLRGLFIIEIIFMLAVKIAF